MKKLKLLLALIIILATFPNYIVNAAEIERNVLLGIPFYHDDGRVISSPTDGNYSASKAFSLIGKMTATIDENVALTGIGLSASNSGFDTTVKLYDIDGKILFSQVINGTTLMRNGFPLNNAHKITIETSGSQDMKIYGLTLRTLDPKSTTTPIPTPTPLPVPEQGGAKAMLTVTLINGFEKEYDLPMKDVDAFLNWYASRDEGRGPGSYAIDKYINNKGPFSKRKDYVVFDKILIFEISEYTEG
ncbi:hypothetical protein ABIE27_000881 [Paenibacillus sp. 4624]|uniref:hypothetical protein n=1 Tax=Paenibacillus sp. 4624 TaxID=3156453 RepID=UPI003D1D521C